MLARRRFGRTDWQVSEIGFGGGAISGEGGGYGFGAITEDAAIDLVKEAYDRGINLFDTAPVYGLGMSERRLGKALASVRSDVILVSKSGVTWDDRNRVYMSNDPKVTASMLHQSLKDLNTDYIDLYFIHWPDKNVDIRKPMEVLVGAKEKGKIRAIGLSNTNPDDFAKASEIAPVDVFQSEWNLFAREVENDLFPLVRDHDLGFMGYGTFDKGILTGRVTTDDRKFDHSDVRSRAPWWTSADRQPKYRAMQEINKLLEDHGCSHVAMALGFSLQSTKASIALCGPKNKDQLASMLEARQEPDLGRASSELLKRCVEIAREHLS